MFELLNSKSGLNLSRIGGEVVLVLVKPAKSHQDIGRHLSNLAKKVRKQDSFLISTSIDVFSEKLIPNMTTGSLIIIDLDNSVIENKPRSRFYRKFVRQVKKLAKKRNVNFLIIDDFLREKLLIDIVVEEVELKYLDDIFYWL